MLAQHQNLRVGLTKGVLKRPEELDRGKSAHFVGPFVAEVFFMPSTAESLPLATGQRFRAAHCSIIARRSASVPLVAK